ncbi:MAG: hypothetical protein ACOYOL_07160 [Chthoniobacterales bacterium]
MATYTSSAALLLAQTDRFRRMKGTAQQVHAQLAREGYADHIALTSGGISSATLAAVGYPFAKRRRPINKKALRAAGFRGGVPLLAINVQTGGLRRGFRFGKSGNAWEVANSVAYAKFILNPQGTIRMVGRGFMGQPSTGAPRTGETVRRWRARNLGMLLKLRDLQRIV